MMKKTFTKRTVLATIIVEPLSQISLAFPQAISFAI
ncbi:hypothetical protein SAMN05428958_1137 [Pantoea sesami]|nr:hypothetical protein SAMN05428958_1137 [Pantoea sesami]